MRFTEAELAFFDDIAKRLKISRTEAAQLGAVALKQQMGLADEDTVSLQERVARVHGDDAVLRFTVNGIDRLNVDVAVAGEPVPDMVANVLFAAAQNSDGTIHLPDEATIVAKDQAANVWYTIGRAPLAEGSTVDVALRRMPDLLQSRASDKRTPAERRHDARMNSLLRQLLREAQGELDDDEEPEP